MKCWKALLAAVLIGGSAVAPAASLSVSEGVTRTPLQQEAVTGTGHEVVQVRVGFKPGASVGRHRHPGDEIVYALEGSLEYRLTGRAPVVLKAGDVLFIPARTGHEVSNVGHDYAAELATYIVPKGSELLVPED